MISLPRFRLHGPRDLDLAARILHDHAGDAALHAGGTDLVVNLRNRVHTPGHLVHLGRIGELRRIAEVEGGALEIGAMTTVTELASHPAIVTRFPVLARAAASVAGPTIRNMATVGGNICLETRCQWYNQSLTWRESCGFCLKKDGEECHVAPGSAICWAVYSGDLAPAFLALDAEVVAHSVRGVRVIPLTRFYLDDGLRKFDLAPDEIVTRVRVPGERAGCRGFYGKLRTRGSVDFPLAGVAVAARVAADGTFRDARVALTALSPRPYLVEGVREALEGRRLDDAGAILEAVQLVRAAAKPLRTGGSASPAYRRLYAGLLARNGLREIAAK